MQRSATGFTCRRLYALQCPLPVSEALCCAWLKLNCYCRTAVLHRITPTTWVLYGLASGQLGASKASFVSPVSPEPTTVRAFLQSYFGYDYDFRCVGTSAILGGIMASVTHTQQGHISVGLTGIHQGQHGTAWGRGGGGNSVTTVLASMYGTFQVRARRASEPRFAQDQDAQVHMRARPWMSFSGWPCNGRVCAFLKLPRRPLHGPLTEAHPRPSPLEDANVLVSGNAGPRNPSRTNSKGTCCPVRSGPVAVVPVVPVVPVHVLGARCGSCLTAFVLTLLYPHAWLGVLHIATVLPLGFKD